MSRTQVKTIELETALKTFQAMLPSHEVSVNSPLSKGAYDLVIDGKMILSGTKKELYQFLKSYIKVYNLINHVYTN